MIWHSLCKPHAFYYIHPGFVYPRLIIMSELITLINEESPKENKLMGEGQRN